MSSTLGTRADSGSGFVRYSYSRESLYKALSGERNPTLDTVLRVLAALVNDAEIAGGERVLAGRRVNRRSTHRARTLSPKSAVIRDSRRRSRA